MKDKKSIRDYLTKERLKQLRRQRKMRVANRLERLPDNQLVALGLKRKTEITYPMAYIDAFSLITLTDSL